MCENINYLEDTLEGTLSRAIELYEDARSDWLNCEDVDNLKTTEEFAQVILRSSQRFSSEYLLPPDIESMHDDLTEYFRSSSPEIKKQIQDIISFHFQDEKISFDKFISEVLPLIQPLKEKIPDKFQNENFFLSTIQERLSIELAKESINKIRQGSARIVNLYRIALTISPSKPLGQFLGRLSRCYIWGFDSECVILCRSAVDTAFRETIRDSLCEKHKKNNADNRIDLAKRIKTAYKESLIDENIKEMAFFIKNCGNDAVHSQPATEVNVFDIIKKTISVLEKIYGI